MPHVKKPSTVAEGQAYLRWWVLRTGVERVRKLTGVRSRRTIYGWIRKPPSLPSAPMRTKLDDLMGLG